MLLDDVQKERRTNRQQVLPRNSGTDSRKLVELGGIEPPTLRLPEESKPEEDQ